MKKLLLLCAMALQGWSSGAAAQLITFDDLSAPTYYGMGSVPNGYAGLNWDGMKYAQASMDLGGPGFFPATISAPYVAFSSSDATFYSDSAFNFDSAYVTNVWYEGNVHFEGYNGDTLLYATDIWFWPDHATFTEFNWTNVTRVSLSSGSVYATALDNISISHSGDVPAVPEPETYALLASGLLFGFMARRKSKR